MRGSLSLQLSLFKKQQAQICEAVEGASRTFRAYEARYRRHTRGPGTVIERSAVDDAVRAADVIYVGDYHTLRLSQRTYLELVEQSLTPERPTVLAVEFVEGRHQASLDAYLSGKLSERAFLGRIGHGAGSPYDLWIGFRPVLEFAKKHGLRVFAIDRRAMGPSSLAVRDAYAAERIAECVAAPDRPRVFVLMGQFHVAPCHLPRCVDETLGPGKARSLVVYQNCDGVWWSLARKGKLAGVEAVKLRDGELCLLRASPVVCQQSFLDYLEAERGDEPLGGRSVTERFRDLARLIARFVGADVSELIDDVAVATAADPDFLDEISTRARLNRTELAQLKRQILSRESYYVPRARMAYLASLSLNHAAEEAAHFVRHACVGAAMEKPRPLADAFYARCMEEALGFFGSRLVNPRRQCTDVGGWAQAFAERSGEERQIAAFVLAHKAAESEGPSSTSRLLPLRREKLFHAVSHALGYMLGDELYRAFEAGTLSKTEVRALFRDPLVDARETYFRWVGVSALAKAS